MLEKCSIKSGALGIYNSVYALFPKFPPISNPPVARWRVRGKIQVRKARTKNLSYSPREPFLFAPSTLRNSFPRHACSRCPLPARSPFYLYFILYFVSLFRKKKKKRRRRKRCALISSRMEKIRDSSRGSRNEKRGVGEIYPRFAIIEQTPDD